ncbi:hypothetical protein FO519_010497 [Halicephalobus sp. NKZ332]|nr:hypothetical protein FO519_010497 [Halicephalobus sp. NKZ332]
MCKYMGDCVGLTINGNEFDVCKNSTCPEGNICQSEAVECLAPPCVKVPKCVLINDTETINRLISSDPCVPLKCPEGQVCQRNPDICLTDPCLPKVQCVNVTITTENGEKNSSVLPTIIPRTCENVTCGEAGHCVMTNFLFPSSMSPVHQLRNPM